MASFVALVGMQFGDEGKGKIVNYLSENFDYVVRYQGGDNAGHTIKYKNKKYVLKIIPSGIFKTKAIISPGAVINPINLLSEIETIKDVVNLKKNLLISHFAHVILEFHVLWDKLMEQLRGNGKEIGSTHKGVGPCYSDKSARVGIRVIDLFDYDELLKKIKINLKIKNPIFEKYNFQTFCHKEVAKKYYEIGKQIKPYLINYFEFINLEILKNKKFLFEGSQGLLLDLDCGTYPYVTSSNIIGSLSHGSNISVQKFKKIIGIVKSYTTRVGNGKLITEIIDKKIHKDIQITGNEFGSVTGRPRRIGWLDLVSLKYSVAISGVTELSLTLLDVLNSVEEINVCVGYQDKKDGKMIDYLPDHSQNIKPLYKTFKGWKDDYSKIFKYEDFSNEIKNYINFLEKNLKIKVKIISYGEDDKSTIYR